MTDYFLLVAVVGLAIVVGLTFRHIKNSGRKQQKMSSHQYRAELFPDTEEAGMYKGEGRRSKARSEAVFH
jgi:hypothetical protein